MEGPADAYCCHGCELAAELIRGAGLEKYYQERDEFAPRSRALDEGWNTAPIETDDTGMACAKVMIDGLRCASCVWVTEHLLQGTSGVVEATVSYATGRCTLKWDPEQVGLPELAGRIATLGYQPRLLGEEAQLDRE